MPNPFGNRRFELWDTLSAILKDYAPEELAGGASDDVLRAIMVDNPRRFLACVPKKARPKI